MGFFMDQSAEPPGGIPGGETAQGNVTSKAIDKEKLPQPMSHF